MIKPSLHDADNEKDKRNIIKTFIMMKKLVETFTVH